MKESYNRDPLVAAAESMMLTEDVAKIKKKVAQLEVGDKTNYGTVVAIGSDSITFKAKDTPKTKIVFRQRKMGSPDYLLMNLVKLTPDGKSLDKSFKEANDFTGAAAAAAVAGEDEFEFNGKTYPVKMDLEVAKKIMSQSLKLAKQLAKDMEEAVTFVESNEFVGAAAAAKVAGKDEFEFNGKTYPVEISQETAEKIMSQAIDLAKDLAKAKKAKKEESTDLEEAAGSLQNTLKVLAKDGISGRVTDMQKLANAIHKNYKAITGNEYQDSDQVATSEIITDLIIHFKVNPDKFISAWDKTIKEAKIPSSNISRFSSPEAALRAAALQKYKTQVFMGDDGKFWVPSTNKEAGQLKKAGYEVYESADLEEATDLTEGVKKIACLECDEVSTAAAWKKNNGFCPKCKVSSRGVAESVSDDLEEEFVVKYSATKSGPIQTMSFDLLPDAKKFLADKEKEGYKGIISKNGKPVKEELEEAPGKYSRSGDKEKYQWGDINNALMAAGIKPMTILTVAGKLRDKALKEAKSSTGYELYHKDFSSAMAHAYEFAKNKYRIEVDPDEISDKVALGPRKPSKGKTNSYRLLGKGGKKAIHVQVHGMEDGRYELNMYKESTSLEETIDLEEARGFTDSSQGAKQAYGNAISLSKSLKKGSNLNKAVNKRLEGKYDSDFAKMEDAIGLILDTLDEFDREYQMSEGANVADLEERSGEEWFTAETRVKSSGQLYSTFYVQAKDMSQAKKKADDVFRELVKTSYPKDWPSYQKKFTVKVMKGDNLGDIMP
jgi:hypothetical protein